jgi:multidrug efflux pump subunit AcrB
MSLAGFAVKRYQFTILVFLMLVTLGVTSWFSIPRSEDPVFPIPVYTVVTVLPGATPSEIEQLVIDPLEKRLTELDRIIELRSAAYDGYGVTSVEFDPGVDVDRKYDEVLREVNAVRPLLPAQVQRVDVEQATSLSVAIAQIALVSETAPSHQLDSIAEVIEDRFATVRGVRNTARWGAPAREVRVEIDPGRVARLGIPPLAVLAAVEGANRSVPAGSIDAGAVRFNVATSGRFRSLEEIAGTVITASDAAVVRVRDVASVRWDYADPVHITRWNGERAVWVSVTQQEGQVIGTVRDALWRELDAVERELPASIRMVRAFDQSVNVEARLSRLGADFVIAIGLVLLTLLPLGLRASGIVMVSIPLSLAIAVTILYWTGFSINQLSIVGFVIALGLLVDDSIVVVENIARFRREGYGRDEAAVLATRQITVAVLGCTATLVFAFLPLLFLPGLSGRYIRSLPVAVVSAVLASLFVSLTIIPWLASRVLSPHEDPEGNRFLRGLQRVIQVTYAPLLHRALAAPRRTVLAALLLFVGSLALVPVVGVSLFPTAGTPQVYATIELPVGATLATTDSAVQFAARVIGAHPNVRGVFANSGRDNPQIYYNVFSRSEAPNRGQLFILLHEYSTRGTPRMLDSLRVQLDRYPGAVIALKEFENGPPIEAPIALRVEGADLDTLRVLAARIEGILLATPGTQYVDNPLRVARTDLRLTVDREKAGLLGVTPAALDATLRLGIAGLGAGDFRAADGKEYPITARFPHQGRPGLDALERIEVASTNGALVPLAQLARTELVANPTVIAHRDRQRAVTVTSFVRSDYTTDRVTTAALAQVDTLTVPSGYRVVAAGEVESRQESFGGIGGAIIVAVFGILAILVLEFKAFRTTLVVASVIPLGFVGGIVALLLTGYTLSFMALIGFVALIGIEIKTSILLVDFTDQLRREGVALDDAIQRAGEIRFVPIVLTAMTAVGGLMPLALQGSGLYSPLAWVIIGGLISSTLFARLVTPAMYKMLAPAEVQS